MTFPTVALGMKVEFMIDGVYTDVTDLRPTYDCYIYTSGNGSADSDPPVVHQLIKKSNQRVITRSVTFKFKDTSAIMNNENPASPYYQKIPRGTRVRVSIDGVQLYFVAIDSVEPDFDNAPRVVTVAFRCTGQYEQRAFGDKPFKSPIYRSVSKDTTVRDFWPCEEGQGANQLTPATRGSFPSVPIGTINYGGYTDLGGAEAALKFNADTFLRFRVRTNSAFTNQWQFDFFLRNVGQRPSDSLVWRAYTTGTVVRWEYTLGNGTQRLIGYKQDNSTAVDTGLAGLSSFQTKGWTHVRLMAQQSGGNVNWKYVFFPVPIASGAFFSGSYAGTVGGPVELQFPPHVNNTDMGLSNVVMFDNYDYSVVDSSGGGWFNEKAVNRFNRVCGEEGISALFVGTTTDSAAMGIQPRLPMMDILRQSVETDGGYMLDSRSSFALTMICRNQFYSQTPEFNLAYASSHLAGTLAPVVGGTSDTTIVNDMTATKQQGGSARYVIPSGDYLHWTPDAPPAGVGTKDGSIDVNPAQDSALNEQAAWGAHLASWREARFETVTVDQARSAVASNAALISAMRSAIPSNVFYVATVGAGAWLPPDEARLMIEGRTDSYAQFGAKTTFNTTQADKYEVDLVNTSGTELLAAVNTAATSWKVRTLLGPEWGTGDAPFHWIVDGEAVRVSSLTTDTPVFVAAGTVSTANNASVTPGLPAGVATDNLMVMQVSIRGTAATVGTPAGWTLIGGVGGFMNHLIFGRHYQAGDAAPTVTVSGGAAGDDVIGRIMAFTNLTMVQGGAYVAGSAGKQSPNSLNLGNGSAQNIAYGNASFPKLYVNRPKCVVFIFGWKQDDWTVGAGVAALAGFTEAWEETTTTGNDSSMVAEYQIQGTTPTNINSGSLVISGGAAAISSSTMMALRPTQTATVVRSKNNVVASHLAGAAIRSWRPGLVGL